MTENGNWTTDNMPDMTGKIAIVTGANSGIGYETARALAARGAQVIMACRNLNKGEAALQRICSEYPQAQIGLMHLDLADLASVRRFAKDFMDRYDQLHLLINNAGIMMPPFGTTVDGLEVQFGVNHLGHFALTGLFLDLVIATPKARVVVLSSVAHRWGDVDIDFDNLNGENGYDRQGAYGQSKLANLLFTYELQRRFEAAGVDAIAAAAHPGYTATNLQAYTWQARLLNPFLGQKPEMGALPSLYAATAPDVGGGDYFGPDGRGEMRGYPTKVQSSDRSHDTALAGKLWAVSEELTGVRYLQTKDHGTSLTMK